MSAGWLDSRLSPLSCPHPDNVTHFRDEDLAISNLTGARVVQDCLDDLLSLGVFHDQQDPDLRKVLDLVLAASPLLTAPIIALLQNR